MIKSLYDLNIMKLGSKIICNNLCWDRSKKYIYINTYFVIIPQSQLFYNISLSYQWTRSSSIFCLCVIHFSQVGFLTSCQTDEAIMSKYLFTKVINSLMLIFPAVGFCLKLRFNETRSWDRIDFWVAASLSCSWLKFSHSINAAPSDDFIAISSLYV